MSTPIGIAHVAEPQPIITRNASPWAGRRAQRSGCSGIADEQEPPDRVGDSLAAQSDGTCGEFDGERGARLGVAAATATATARVTGPTGTGCRQRGDRAERAEQREHRLVQDGRDRDRSDEADDGARHAPPADQRLGRRRWWLEGCELLDNGAARAAQHRTPPAISDRPAGGDGIGHGRWSDHEQTARTELDRHVVRHAGGPVDGAVGDDDGHSPGELEDRHRPVDADVEHRVVGFDVRVGETHGGALGAPDEVPTGTEADRRRDRGSGDLDDRHDRGRPRIRRRRFDPAPVRRSSRFGRASGRASSPGRHRRRRSPHRRPGRDRRSGPARRPLSSPDPATARRRSRPVRPRRGAQVDRDPRPPVGRSATPCGKFSRLWGAL